MSDFPCEDGAGYDNVSERCRTYPSFSAGAWEMWMMTAGMRTSRGGGDNWAANPVTLSNPTLQTLVKTLSSTSKIWTRRHTAASTIVPAACPIKKQIGIGSWKPSLETCKRNMHNYRHAKLVPFIFLIVYISINKCILISEIQRYQAFQISNNSLSLRINIFLWKT